MQLTRKGLLALLIGIGAVGIGTSTPALAVGAELDRGALSADPIATTPTVVTDGRVNGITTLGGYVYVGGSFTTPQPFAFRYLESTGVVDPSWNPVLDGEVRAVDDDRTSVYFGGFFETVDGVARRGLVAFDATGAMTPFDARLGRGRVYDLVARPGAVYLGGNFTRVGGQVRERLAIVGSDGAVLPFSVPVRAPFSAATKYAWVNKLDVTPDGRRMVILGNFRSVGNQLHPQMAVVDVAMGTVRRWFAPQAAMQCDGRSFTYMRDVDISPNGRFFVIATTGGYKRAPALCDAVARFPLDPTNPTNVRASWYAMSHGDTFTSVAVTHDAVYVGGHFRRVRTSPREGLGALDPTLGRVLEWNPGRERGVGVFAMHTTATRLYIGHDTNRVGGEHHPRIAAFDLSAA